VLFEDCCPWEYSIAFKASGIYASPFRRPIAATPRVAPPENTSPTDGARDQNPEGYNILGNHSLFFFIFPDSEEVACLDITPYGVMKAWINSPMF
jgi:hypothetical protein